MLECETVREEGAPLPLKPLKRWDDGRNVLLAGDGSAGRGGACSGEGIYYAMIAGRMSPRPARRFWRQARPRSWPSRAAASCANTGGSS